MIRRLAPPTVVQPGGITSGSAVVTGLVTAGLEGALRAVGTGLKRKTYVQSIDSPTQVTLTQAATATNAAASLTFDLEPIMLQDAKDQLRIATDFHDDDWTIAVNIRAARTLAEDWFARAYIAQQFRYTLDGFDQHRLGNPAGVAYGYGYGDGYGYGYGGPSGETSSTSSGWGIKFPRADLISVDAVTYIDVQGVTRTIDPTGYYVSGGAPGAVYPAYGLSWPGYQSRPDTVTIDFTAGYGATAESVPDNVKAAILMLVAHLYENREATVTSSIGLKEAPLGVEALLSLEDWGYRG